MKANPVNTFADGGCQFSFFLFEKNKTELC